MLNKTNKHLLVVETTCRTCLKQKSAGELRSLLDNDLASQINEVASIQLNFSSPLPTSICNDCLGHLKVAVNFKKQVLEAESHLKELVCNEDLVIHKTLTVLDSGVISDGHEIVVAEAVDNDNDVNQDAVAGNHFCTLTDNGATSTAALTNVITVKTDPKIVNLKCDLCFLTFKFEFTYKKHLLKHGTSWGCQMCPLMFDDSEAYLRHVKNDHPQFKPFACLSCESRFISLAALKKHHKRAHNIGKSACGLRGETIKKPNSLKVSTTKCDICHKKLSSSHSLRNHIKIHDGEKKHRCEICGSTFIHRFSLRAHMQTHTGEKPFHCKVCDRRYSTSSYLKIHLRTHTAEKPYVCPFCPKKFVSRCALAAHEKVHTGEKRYQCDSCGWRTSRSADLRTHIRMHTGEKPYSCSQCGKSFKTASNRSAHCKTHLGLKEHRCSICDKAFGDPRTLKSHIRIHTGEMPYQCHICGHRFKQSGQLSAHRKMHQVKEVPDNT